MSSGRCNGFQAELSAYLDGELTPPRRSALEAHLAVCAGCRQHLAELRQIAGGVAALPRAELSADLLAGVRDRLAKPERRPWAEALFRPFWLKVPLEAAAVVAMVLGAAFLLRPPRQPVAGDEALFAHRVKILEPASPADSSPAPAEAIDGLALAPAPAAPALPPPAPATQPAFGLGDLRSTPAPAPTVTAPDVAAEGAMLAAKLKDDSTASTAGAPLTLGFGWAEEKAAETEQLAGAQPSTAAPAVRGVLDKKREASEPSFASAESGRVTTRWFRADEDLVGSLGPAGPGTGATAAVVELIAASEASGRQQVAALADDLGGRLISLGRDQAARRRAGVIGVVWVELPADQVAAFQARVAGATARTEAAAAAPADTAGLAAGRSGNQRLADRTDGVSALSGAVAAGGRDAEATRARAARVLVEVELRRPPP